MTKRDVVRVVRNMGLTCKWDSEWKEFCINYSLYDERRHEDNTSYHTDNIDDALATAQMMASYK